MYRLTRVLASVLLLVVWSALGVAARDATIEGAPLFRETSTPARRGPARRLRASCALAMPKSILACWAAIIPCGSAPATVLLNLFPDATFIAERDGAQATSTGAGMIWMGHLQGVPADTATLVAEDGVLVGNVQTTDRFYEVRYACDGLHRIAETNPRAFGPD